MKPEHVATRYLSQFSTLNSQFPIIDSHLHVIDPARFAFHDGPGYRPLAHELGPREQLIETLNSHGVHHGLLVQPSCYGCDNSAMLDAMAAAHRRFKGVAVVDVNASEAELHSLKDRGVVGIRWNLEFDQRVLSAGSLNRLLEKVRALDWWVEVHASGTLLIAALSLLHDAKVKSLVDHWGRPDVTAGPQQKSFQELLRYGREGHAAVKLSAPYRLSVLYADLDPFAESLLAAFTPQRCVWGSDWPFINSELRPSYSTVQTALGRWVSGDDLHQVLWGAPARLFGFA